MKVVITGATGLLGARLTDELRRRGDHVVALSRDPESASRELGAGVEVHAWQDPTASSPPAPALAGAGAVVNLLGEPLAQRWTSEAKRKIRDSRVLGTRSVIAALRELPDDRRPRVLVSQSATGYYGPRGEDPVDEQSPPGEDFLAELTQAWELEAQAASELEGVRVVCTRTGVVLAPHGGALEKLLLPFRLGLGGPVAGGRQYVPWIHLDDAIAALIRCIDDDRALGPMNVTAPRPATNAELSRALGAALHRPAVLPIPALALRLLYGEMATTVTTGQRALPARLLALGHEFRHPDLADALRDVLDRR